MLTNKALTVITFFYLPLCGMNDPRKGFDDIANNIIIPHILGKDFQKPLDLDTRAILSDNLPGFDCVSDPFFWARNEALTLCKGKIAGLADLYALSRTNIYWNRQLAPVIKANKEPIFELCDILNPNKDIFNLLSYLDSYESYLIWNKALNCIDMYKKNPCTLHFWAIHNNNSEIIQYTVDKLIEDIVPGTLIPWGVPFFNPNKLVFWNILCKKHKVLKELLKLMLKGDLSKKPNCIISLQISPDEIIPDGYVSQPSFFFNDSTYYLITKKNGF